MGLRTLSTRIFGVRNEGVSADEWDASRAQQVAAFFEQKDRDAVARDPLGGVHWIAMVCFVEEIDPETLPLGNRDKAEVLSGLERIGAIGALEAYAACLEKLSLCDDDRDEGSDVEN